MTEPTTSASPIDPAAGLAVITGGSRGIGRALATGFAAAGHPVLLTARSAADAESAAEAVARSSVETAGPATERPRVIGAALDVTDPASVAAFADAAARVAADWSTPLRTLVNNAGMVEASEGPVWEADADDMAAVIETNLTGVFRVVHALLPQLFATAESTGAPVRIIDLNSGSGAQGTPSHAAYSASKAGLFRLAQSLVDYGHDRGLRVFEMAPGVVESDMTKSMPMHDHRVGSDWTDPQAVAALAVGLASGRLDAWTGRYVRAGIDTPASLEAAAGTLTAGDLGDGLRTLSMRMQ
ncbi:SDR family oxidoreductase [Brevibacterium yomogidense]|uniref:SDR family oxidoreductase n=1 Tax=Brevibacterium yomogidense TaxID=946573 RepID=UPI0018E03885|nr:SDR family oxidoreductase [Brevibacterium yomogidense]